MTSVAASSTTLKPSSSNWRTIAVFPAPGAPVMMNLLMWFPVGMFVRSDAATQRGHDRSRSRPLATRMVFRGDYRLFDEAAVVRAGDRTSLAFEARPAVNRPLNRDGRARYISPMPPAPSGERISNGPNRVPGLNAIVPLRLCEFYTDGRTKNAKLLEYGPRET